MSLSIAIVDDHQLFLKSVSMLVGSFEGFHIVTEAMNGKVLIDQITAGRLQPDIVLIDVDMPVMDGAQTAKELSRILPVAKLVALSMKGDDTSIIKMLKAGCCSYLLKDIHPDQLEKALKEISQRGFFNGDPLNLQYRKLMVNGKPNKAQAVSDKELQFLQLACTDLTYKQIADKMQLSQRTIDGYRESLFEKFQVQSRVGMVMEALRKQLVAI
jgi:DNA-binding NarL/FixJ family response regulator